MNLPRERAVARRVAVVFCFALLALGLVPAAALAEPLELPLYIRLGSTLLYQFGYAPEYTRNVPAFDSQNRPYIRSRTADQDGTSFVNVLQDDGTWARASILAALAAAYPDFEGTWGAGGYASDRVVFDTQDRAYTVLTIRLEEGDLRNVLLYSLDRCLSWTVVELPFGDQQPRYDDRNHGNVACETFSGHNALEGPPFLALWREVDDWPGMWATRNELYVVQPYFDGDVLVVPPLTRVSDHFLGMIQSAGGASFAATAGETTYFLWTGLTTRASKGTPTWVGVFDHATRTVIDRRRLFFAQPGNDVHDTPGICLDSTGVLHVVGGAHGRPMLYTHSLAPRDIAAWTPPSRILDSGYVAYNTDSNGVAKMTYLSLVCDATDTLHLVCRQLRRRVDSAFDGHTYHALVYLRRPVGGTWSLPLRLAARSDGPGYVNFHQKLVLDRRDDLYLSFNLGAGVDPTWLRPLRRFRLRMVLHSTDGQAWEFATTDTFRAGLLPATPPG
jgi:hypothetical protein